MIGKDLPEDVKQFLFAHIESVEQIEVLLLMRQNKEKWWSAKNISDELRNSASSVANRLKTIKNLGLTEENEAGQFRYNPSRPDDALTVDRLAEVYKVSKHRVLEVIFSPMKRARNFADAFLISSNHKKDEDKNG